MSAGTLDKAFGYRGDNMALPVASVADSVPFYERMLGFHVVSRSAAPPRSAVLARDAVQLGLVENGGDPTQDGCAFHVSNVQAVHDELSGKGLGKAISAISIEQRDGADWKVFFVVAPDGLCYWFGERQA